MLNINLKSNLKKTFFPNFILTVLIFMLSVSNSHAAILWSGDYETGNFLQWHLVDDPNTPNFSQMPSYGRPAPYGDGSLLSIVTNPVRQGTYAAKFTVKNSINGSEPVDCDAAGKICTRRRSEVTAEALFVQELKVIPYLSERWVSVSHFVPSDWDDGGSNWGITVFQIKPNANISPTIDINIASGKWQIYHRWSDIEDVNYYDDDLPWQYQMFYDSTYPRSDNWPDGLAHFPNETASKAALGNLNKGGWTDWIFHFKTDNRGSNAGGTGFLNIWKRAGSGDWVHVLDIVPGNTNRGGMTFNHGVGYRHTGGFGIKAGMYMAKEQVWNLPQNRVIYNDNIKIGSEKATFAMMTPEYSGTPQILPGDLNLDGVVNIFDYNIFIQDFGKTGTNLVSDLNKDGKVDIFDYNIFLQNFGRTS